MLAISTDFIATLSHWAKELNASYPLISDHDRKLSETYGVLIPAMGIANRATFVVGQDGIVKEIITGGDAIDPTSAVAACPIGKR